MSKEELDGQEARSVTAFLAKAGRQPDDMLRFFDRKDYFSLVGRDADTVAVEYFKSTACVKTVQSGGERCSFLSINKKMASEVMRTALLQQRRRVEVHISHHPLPTSHCPPPTAHRPGVPAGQEHVGAAAPRLAGQPDGV